MKMMHVLTKPLSALLVCDVIVFASLGAIVIVAFAEGGLALAVPVVIGLSVFVGISWYLGEALARLLQPRTVARLEPGCQEDRVECAPVSPDCAKRPR